jgi:beta-glucosidase
MYAGHGFAASEREASVMGITAGTDLNCGVRFQNDLMWAVDHFEVSEAAIDQAAVRLFEARCRLGEFADPGEVPYTAIPADLLDSPAHRELAQEVTRASMVLLKNDGILPLDASAIDEIAVIGPNADRAIFGGYSGFASAPVNPLAGIRSHLRGFGVAVNHEQGCTVSSTEKEGFAAAASLAQSADVAVVVVGTDLTVSNEELDRNDITLPGVQEALIETVFAANPNTVVVLVTGMPLAINWTDDHVPAILNAWYGGQAAGTVIAEILFGDTNPSARLPQTFYRSVDDLPPMDDYAIAQGGRTYMYFEGDALYPFGHGLSYTSFDYDNLSITPQTITKDQSFTVTFEVKNTGVRPGAEVTQIYVHDVASSLKTPIKQLKRFERVTLEQDESRTVTATIGASELSHYDSNEAAFVVAPGEFEIKVGASSADIRLEGTVAVAP